MDLYDRWNMRASGEARHQAQNAAEKATYAMLGLLEEEGWLSDILPSREVERSAYVDQLAERFSFALRP